jgi:methylmalonyl-CoA/ethylmalonyl-CoA epimerase
MIQQIDHLGIAVKSLEAARAHYEGNLGMHCLGTTTDPALQVNRATCQAGEVRLELLEPTGPDSPVAKFMELRGEGIHHVTFRATDLSAALKQAEANEAEMIHESPLATESGQLAYFHPVATCGLLTALIQSDSIAPGSEG